MCAGPIPRIIRARRETIGLSDAVQTDYEAITSQARGIISEVEVDDQAITDAASLLEAELLPGWDEEWLLLDRERHRQLRIHALETTQRASHLQRATTAGPSTSRALPYASSRYTNPPTQR